MILHPLLATCLWLALAGGVWFWPARGKRWSLVLLIVTGVPVLGMLTHDFGPFCGIFALLAGTLLLKVIHHGHRTETGAFSLERPSRPQ